MPTSFSYLDGLVCSGSGKVVAPDKLRGLSDEGFPLLSRYDLCRLGASVDRDKLEGRKTSGVWKYHELLPVRDPENIVTLGERQTPLLPVRSVREANDPSVGKIYVKDEGFLPTHSFKARGMSVALSRAMELGEKRFVAPSAGNAAAALAAYAGRAGAEAVVVCPSDTHRIILDEIATLGARLILINGLIAECGVKAHEIADDEGLFNLATLHEPYRLEGKKTIAFELAEQFGWRTPSIIFYPTGGGTGLIAIWKAFNELKTLGWISGNGPRMVAVQAKGCAPIERAWRARRGDVFDLAEAATAPHGLRVPAPFGEQLILQAITESNGFSISVGNDEIASARTELARREGIYCSLEGAATFAAFRIALRDSMIEGADNIVCFNSASGLIC